MPPKRNHNRSKLHNKNTSKEAAEINAMAGCVLPRDIIIAVLARLPVKSLVRFKCVCKPWFNLLSNPNFIKIHTTLHSSQAPRSSTFSVQTHLLTCRVLGIDPHTVTPVDSDHPYDIFLDHCNGLICMGRPSFTDKIILWNPATNLWKILPDSRSNFGAVQMVSIGFGCNDSGDDFKVVRIFCLKGKKMKVGVEVYSSKSDCWRTIELQLGLKFKVMYPKNHVIVNGNPYWLVCFAERLNEETGEVEEASALLGFDATNMKFKAVPLPIIDKLGERPLPFVNWEGSIAVLDCVKKDGDRLQGIDVWCYDDVEGVWIRKKSFGVTTPGLQVDQCLDYSSSCGKIVGGCTNGQLFIFDTKTGCVGVSEVKKRRGCSFQIFAYDESLAFVKGMTPAVVSDKEVMREFDIIDGFFVSSLRHRNGETACYYALAS